MGRLQPDRQEIDRALAVLYQPGDVVELRIPKTDHQGTISGYFDDPQKLARALASQNGSGIYTTLNPVTPALLARSANHVREKARTTTSDKDIAARRWLLVDCDPVRPADISASDKEHEAALERARDIRAVLTEEGWPMPVMADSGNGAHLIYWVALPNVEASTKLLEAVLDAMAARFSDGVVEIDRTVFNAGRIVKAYGTIARKGDDLPERPHRLSRIIDAPAALEVVPRELLEGITRKTTAKPAPPSTTGQPRVPFSVEAWIRAHALPVRDPVMHEGGWKWVLYECPFNAEHKAPDAAIFEGPDGKPGFKCFHASCVRYGWKELRERFEGPRPIRTVRQPDKAESPEFQSGSSVFRCEDEPVTAVVADLFFPGFTLLTGRPKGGKSWLALQTATAVARGTALAGWLNVPKAGRVLYLALEEPRQRTTARMHNLHREGESIDALDNIRFVYQIPPMMKGGAAALDAALTEWPALLVIIDTVRAFTQMRTRTDSNAVQADYDTSNVLRELAAKHRTAIVGVDHTRKTAGDVIDAVIGTSGTTAGCDAVMGMARTPGGDMVLTARGREHEELSYSMRFSSAPGTFGWEIYGSGDEASMSAERSEIVELLRHEAPLTPAKIALLLRKNANTVRSLLYRMVSAGRISKQSGGGYALNQTQQE